MTLTMPQWTAMYDGYCRSHKIESIEDRSGLRADTIRAWSEQSDTLARIEIAQSRGEMTEADEALVHALRQSQDADIRARAGAVLCRMAPHA